MTDLERFRDLPTVMTAEEELEVVRALVALPLDVLRHDRAGFVAVVDQLDESHVGGGSFGLTPENEGEFLRFATWLRATGEALGLDWQDVEWSFDVTYAQMVRTFPGMEREAPLQPPAAQERATDETS